MTAHIQEPMIAHMTMASIANITRYTDPEDYEFILVSNDEKFPVRDDYKVLKIDRYERVNNTTYNQAMNIGAKLAKGDYLCFIQNDVFVWEYWLNDLKEYILRNLADCVIPDQVPRDRAFVKQAQMMDYEEAMKYGSRDEGLMFMTREAYDQMKGFRDDLKILQGKDTLERMANAGVRQIDTCKVMISHIMAATNLSLLHKDPKEYDERMKHDAAILNK